MACLPNYNLQDKTWPMSDDYNQWTHTNLMEWISLMDGTFSDHYEGAFNQSNIDGSDFNLMGNTTYLQSEFGMSPDVALQFSVIVQTRIKKYNDHLITIANGNITFVAKGNKNIISNNKPKPNNTLPVNSSEEKKMELRNDPNDLQIANIIKCESCDDRMEDNILLYRCTSTECKDSVTANILCKDCFKFLHKKKKRLHSFLETADYIVSINAIIKAGLNDKFVKLGKMRIYLEKEFKKNKLYHALFGGLNLFSIMSADVILRWGGYTITPHVPDIRLVVCGIELALLCYRRCTNKIETWEELARLAGKSVIGNCINSMCGVGFVALLKAVAKQNSMPILKHTCNLNLLPTATGWSIYILAMLAGIGAQIGTGWVYDKVCKPTEQKKREVLLQDALQFFQFGKDISVINDAQKFNKRILKKFYYKYALRHHPDRNDNSDHTQWIKLCSYYGILVAVCDERDKNSTVQQPKSGNKKALLVSTQL